MLLDEPANIAQVVKKNQQNNKIAKQGGEMRKYRKQQETSNKQNSKSKQNSKNNKNKNNKTHAKKTKKKQVTNWDNTSKYNATRKEGFV